MAAALPLLLIGMLVVDSWTVPCRRPVRVWQTQVSQAAILVFFVTFVAIVSLGRVTTRAILDATAIPD